MKLFVTFVALFLISMLAVALMLWPTDERGWVNFVLGAAYLAYAVLWFRLAIASLPRSDR